MEDERLARLEEERLQKERELKEAADLKKRAKQEKIEELKK